ncbi:MAG: hypothetical protein ACI85N_002375, partial [Gammaproteobacteria bacterium]
LTESSGAGDFTQNDAIDASWKHEWSSKLSTNLKMNYGENTFDQDTTGRSDDIFGAGASVDYKIRRWLDLGAGYSYEERDSTLAAFDYKRNKVEAFVTVKF